MNEIANSFLLVYAGLFPIVNPVGSALVFLGLTRHRSDQERRTLARRIALNRFFLLLGSLFVGSHVLEFFGITLPVVCVAGGLVVSAFAWKLLHADRVGGSAHHRRRCQADCGDGRLLPLDHAAHGRPGIHFSGHYARQPAAEDGDRSCRSCPAWRCGHCRPRRHRRNGLYLLPLRRTDHDLLGESGTNVLVRLSCLYPALYRHRDHLERL